MSGPIVYFQCVGNGAKKEPRVALKRKKDIGRDRIRASRRLADFSITVSRLQRRPLRSE